MAEVGAGFQVLSSSPIDSRIVKDVSEFLTVNDNLMPEVYPCWTKDGRYWIYRKTNTMDATTGRFREFQGGSEDSTPGWASGVDYVVDDVVINNNRKYQSIKDHTSSSNFEDDADNWIELVDKYFIVTQSQYDSMVTDGVITDDNSYLYIIKDANGTDDASTSQEVDNAYMLTVELTEGNPEVVECTKTTQTLGLEKTTVIVANQDSSDTNKIKANDLVSITKEIGGKVVYNYYILDSETKGVDNSIPKWKENTDYSIGDLVLNNNRKYQAIKNHTSSSDFSSDDNNWIELVETYVLLTVEKYNYLKDNGLLDNKIYIKTDEADSGDSSDTGSVGNTTAESTSYTNTDYPEYTNVDLALDAILAKINYVPIKIESFTISPSTTAYEIGSSISSLTFSWSLNKDATTQTLTDCTINITDRSVTYSTPVTNNKTFTLTVGDGENIATSNKTISFLNKIHWGNATEPASYDSAFILGLSNGKLTSSNKADYSFNCADGEYAYFATPSSMVVASAWVNGFQADLEEVATVTHINASGYTSEYKITRFNNSGLGSFVATVK